MPYQNELADKTSHIDIIKNPDVADFYPNVIKLNMILLNLNL